jgi:hypothetical protein
MPTILVTDPELSGIQWELNSSGVPSVDQIPTPVILGAQWELNSSGVPNVDQIPNPVLLGAYWEVNSSGVPNVDQIPNPILLGSYWETNSSGVPNFNQIPNPITIGIYFETNIPSGTFIEITLPVPAPPASGEPIDQAALGYYGPYIAHVWAGDELTVRDTYTTRASALNRPPDRTTFRSV